MLEMIRQIPGPVFLFVYALVIAGGVYFGRKWIKADGSEERSLPDYAQYDPISIALLRGGVNEVIRTAVFLLVEKKRIEISTSLGKPILKAAAGASQGLGRVESDVLGAVQQGIEKPSKLFRSLDLQEKLEEQLAPITSGFERARLLKTAQERGQTWMKKLSLIALVLSLGAAKMHLGVIHDRPVGLLAMELLLAIILLPVLLTASPLTTLGQRYMEGLERHFGWMEEELSRGKQPKGIDPAMAVAIFGVSVISAFGTYEAYASAFPARRAGFGDTSTGCGGSTGCSGGGGGCGGCGGGGGD
jgi:uncharacterized protein (TIGR04222 family)